MLKSETFMHEAPPAHVGI